MEVLNAIAATVMRATQTTYPERCLLFGSRTRFIPGIGAAGHDILDHLLPQRTTDAPS